MFGSKNFVATALFLHLYVCETLTNGCISQMRLYKI